MYKIMVNFFSCERTKKEAYSFYIALLCFGILLSIIIFILLTLVYIIFFHSQSQVMHTMILGLFAGSIIYCFCSSLFVIIFKKLYKNYNAYILLLLTILIASRLWIVIGLIPAAILTTFPSED